MFFVLHLVRELLKRIHTGDIFKAAMTEEKFAKSDLIFEPVHSERRRRLSFCLLAKPVDSIIYKSSNSMCHFHCLAGNPRMTFFNNATFFSLRNIY